jgi:FKBP-type peptidyl-prolyl cis-trans isomerase
MKNYKPISPVLLLSLFILIGVAMSASANEPIAVPADVAGPPEDAEFTDSGLASKLLVAGTGQEHPDAWDDVTVHYSGWTTDGKMFDSSISRGQKAHFPLNNVISGWTEGLQLMVVGEKRRFWIPEKLAYQGKRPPLGILVFDVELLEITDNPVPPPPPPPPPVPEDVAAPPADAEVTTSGLASRVLKPGTGTVHPTPANRVKVHYSGWTTDGKLFDSSVVRGEPIGFSLQRVITGWIEGLQLMVVGEKRRFWIPENLAYKGEREPFGVLVFDVELLEIEY